MKNVGNGMVTALREHLFDGHVLTQLESAALFGVAGTSFTAEIYRLRREGWVIHSQRVPYAKAMTRMRQFLKFEPPVNLPIREIQFTEYWISK